MKKPKTLEQAIAAIKAINTRGFWNTKTVNMIDPVPNMSARSGIMTTSPVQQDEISDKLKFTDEEFELILYCAKSFPQLALYVHNTFGGFHPIYTVVYFKSPLFPAANGENKWNGEMEHEHLIKWYNSNRHCHMPQSYGGGGENLDDKFLQKLYDKKNVAKLKLFSMEIRQISHYWY